MTELLNLTTSTVQKSQSALCKFITPNDTGSTGGHQCGFHISKEAWSMFLEEEGQRGSNITIPIRIRWQNDFYTNSCFKYYGVGTRNEYRITRFGHSFPYLTEDNVGDLLVLARFDKDYYEAFVLQTDDDIDGFFSFFNLSYEKTNQIIDIRQQIPPEQKLLTLIADFVSRYSDFPETRIMAQGARVCYNEANGIIPQNIVAKPDDILLGWLDTEYSLFKYMEEKVYADICTKPFPSLDSFVSMANEVLNRRKSRAGKSLEHHLADIFTKNELMFEEQAVTEENKKPDFLFPNSICYHNIAFPGDLLTVLGAKTTCKDRWRQVLNEADRVEQKYLFTLQQGISANQLKEMHDYKLHLVVPHRYLTSFPKEYRDDISDLTSFIEMVKERQSKMRKNYFF
ncbi:MAG: restriction endonuclease [Bacteroidaceae bacterium]|nr:restriction endonuclease [Bacteroidaceae bacterium]